MEEVTAVVAKKRSRGKVFTNEEINFLLESVEKHKNILECKETDGSTWTEKKNTWDSICAQFNGRKLGPRTTQSLQDKWNLLKKEAKKEYAAAKQMFYKTGGGEYSEKKISATSERVNRICSALTIQGSNSSPDCDNFGPFTLGMTEFIPEIQYEAEATNVIDELIRVEENETSQYEVMTMDDFSNDENDANSQNINAATVQKNWSSYNTSMLRGPKTSALITMNEKSAPKSKNNKTYNAYHEKIVLKKEVLAIQKIYFQRLLKAQEEEDEFRREEIQHKREKMKRDIAEQRLRMRQMKAQHQQLMRQRKELHELELKLKCSEHYVEYV